MSLSMSSLKQALPAPVKNVLRPAYHAALAAGRGILKGILILTVTDDGRGFPGTSEEMHQKGVGLKIISSRVKTMGGKLTVDSTPQKGTNVTVEIPLN